MKNTNEIKKQQKHETHVETSPVLTHTSKARQNNGITLIALVITIIVMLILVAVTISMVVNGGLFEYAGKAVGETQNALDAEHQLINDIMDEYIKPNLPKKGITAAEMQSDLATYLGQKIAYGGAYEDASTYGNGEWEIFYADGEHIYIITKGHLANAALSITGYNGTSDFTTENLQSKYKAVRAGLLNKTYDPTASGTEADPYLKYTSTNNNMKATQYLLDSTVWASYSNNEYAEWAIGGPTLELFVNSYNAYYPDKAVTIATPIEKGYLYEDAFYESGSVPFGTYLNHSTSTCYWLACPATGGVCYVWGDDAAVDSYSNRNYTAFRPIVCLDSDVQIIWDETASAYTISRIS